MKLLKDIKKEHESLVRFATTQSYSTYYLLCDADLVTDLDHADIGGIIEYTLHRMIESGFSVDDINYNSNMYIPTARELADMEEYEEFSHVDLGYVLGGLMYHIEFENESDEV